MAALIVETDPRACALFPDRRSVSADYLAILAYAMDVAVIALICFYPILLVERSSVAGAAQS